MSHPNAYDNPQGTDVDWSNSNPDQVEVLIWTNYSPATGEYNAIAARFSVDEANKTLRLEHVAIKRKYSSWDETLTNPASFVSDRMKRVARAFMAHESGSPYWRVVL